MKIKSFTKVIFTVILGSVFIASLVLNVLILKNVTTLKSEHFEIAWNIETINYNLDDAQKSLDEINDYLYSIKSDVSDIEYYVQH
jgi:hypothetical protein